MKTTLFILSICLCPILSFAQNAKEDFVEIDRATFRTYTKVNTLCFKEKGVVVVMKDRKSSKKKDFFRHSYLSYTPDLKVQASFTDSIDGDLREWHTYVDDDFMYVMLGTKFFSSKDLDRRCELHKINPVSLERSVFELDYSAVASSRTMIVVDNILYVAGKSVDEAFLVTIDLNSSETSHTTIPIENYDFRSTECVGFDRIEGSEDLVLRFVYTPTKAVTTKKAVMNAERTAYMTFISQDNVYTVQDVFGDVVAKHPRASEEYFLIKNFGQWQRGKGGYEGFMFTYIDNGEVTDSFSFRRTFPKDSMFYWTRVHSPLFVEGGFVVLEERLKENYSAGEKPEFLGYFTTGARVLMFSDKHELLWSKVIRTHHPVYSKTDEKELEIWLDDEDPSSFHVQYVVDNRTFATKTFDLEGEVLKTEELEIVERSIITEDQKGRMRYVSKDANGLKHLCGKKYIRYGYQIFGKSRGNYAISVLDYD